MRALIQHQRLSRVECGCRLNIGPREKRAASGTSGWPEGAERNGTNGGGTSKEDTDAGRYQIMARKGVKRRKKKKGEAETGGFQSERTRLRGG